MKRTYSAYDSGQEQLGSTPKGQAPKPNLTVRPWGNNTGKRQRQTSMRQFVNVNDTPTLSIAAQTNYADKETPTLLGGHATAAGNSSANMTVSKALANISLATPLGAALPSLTHAVGPFNRTPVDLEDDNSRQYAETVVHSGPATLGRTVATLSASLGGVTGFGDFLLKDDDEDEGLDDDGFRIVSSQTYVRPRPEEVQQVADERSVSWGRGATAEPSSHPPSQPGGGATAAQPTNFAGAFAATRVAPVAAAKDDKDVVMTDQNEDPNAELGATQATQVTDPVEPEGHASQRVTPTQLVVNTNPPLNNPSQPHQDGEAGPSHSQPLPATSTDQAVTPELMPIMAVCHGAQAQGSGGPGPGVPKPLAPLFMPRSQRKYLLLIRHGESEYNAAASTGRSVADPLIFDAPLTAKGIQQCSVLRKTLAQDLGQLISDYGEPVWLVSPLTRALQTFMLACPFPDRLPPMQQAQLAALRHRAGKYYQAPAVGAAHTEATSGPPPAPLHVEVHASISEFLLTPGDVGRPPADLIRDFPQLEGPLSSLPNPWWYTTDKKKSCALTKKFEATEPRHTYKTRVEAFSKWLSNRPEKLFIMVGHSCFWKQFMGPQHARAGGGYMKNCEVVGIPY